MRSIFSLYKLKMTNVIKSTVLVMPTVAVVAFLGVMYSVIPVQITGSFLISGFFLFIISVYISMSIQLKEKNVHEEIFIMHSRRNADYYISRELVLYSIMLFYVVVVIAYPLISSKFKEDFFTRTLKPVDVLYGTLIVIGNGICGIALGDLFHQRIITRKKNSILFVVLTAVLAICKVSIIEKWASAKVLNIILPPLMDGFDMVRETDIFDPKGTMLILAHSALYVAVLVAVKIYLLRRFRFK